LVEADCQLEDRRLLVRQRKQDLQFAGGEALPLEKIESRTRDVSARPLALRLQRAISPWPNAH
jgi:hypothetical protein